MESIKIEKRPRDDSIDIVNKDNCKIPHLETKDTESWHRIWDELNNIVRTLVSVDSNKISDREINDLLMVISIDPGKLTFFDIEYGSQNVEMAIRKASKVLYPEGIMDENLSDYLCCRRKKLIRSSNISYLSKKSIGSAMRGIKVVSKALHNLNIFHVPQYQIHEFETEESQLLILMSVDPDILHYDGLSIDIGQTKCEIGIAQCKHILERIMKLCRQETEFKTFQAKRNKKILIHGREHVKNQFPNYDDIFKNVRVIVEKYWNEKCELQLDALTVLFIIEPKLVHSKYLFTAINNFECLDTIEDEVRNRMIDKTNKAATLKDTKCTVYAGLVSPIISHFDPYLTTKEIKDLRKQLQQEVNHDMSPKVLHLNGKFIVCSNTEAFEWLKTRLNKKNAIQNTEKKSIRVAMLSQLRLRQPFSTYMENIKEQHPILHTELWIYLESESDSMIYVQMDMSSIAELEQRKRCIQVNENILKFKMFYAP